MLSALYPLFFQSLEQPPEVDPLAHISDVSKLAQGVNEGSTASLGCSWAGSGGCLSVRRTSSPLAALLLLTSLVWSAGPFPVKVQVLGTLGSSQSSPGAEAMRSH